MTRGVFSASRTSVVTAFSTSVAARSVRGLKLCLRQRRKLVGLARFDVRCFRCGLASFRHDQPGPSTSQLGMPDSVRLRCSARS